MSEATKSVLMFFCGDIIPVSQGSDRYIYEIARYLHGRSDVNLTLAVLGGRTKAMDEGALAICSHIIWMNRPKRWGFADVINKLFARCGIDLLKCFAVSLALRKDFRRLCGDQGLVIINYAHWFPLLPRWIRQNKTLVITHDIGWYRRKSFLRRQTLLAKLLVWFNKRFEVNVLKTFGRVAVLADYERKLLVDAGIPSEKIIRTGVPMRFGPIPKSDARPYDFLMIGGNSYQNEEAVKCFVSRVIPLLKGRNVVFAAAGSICKSKIWDSLVIPPSVELRRLGYVDDLVDVCALSKIGVGTVPYGSGVKIKVVEMIANGLPVVVTNHGIEGVPSHPDGFVNIDEDPQEVASKRILQWLDDPIVAIKSGRAICNIVRQSFTPEATLKSLVTAIGSLS